ncbi:hypothetical protein FACS1894166_02390 [Bacilli bacterium]|nr:hypothetical protein FACS1894166_02390 [Bacilli bacterium]
MCEITFLKCREFFKKSTKPQKCSGLRLKFAKILLRTLSSNEMNKEKAVANDQVKHIKSNGQSFQR